MDHTLLTFLTLFCFSIPIVNSQQNYSGNSVLDCDQNDETGPSTAFLYTCNGQEQSCKSFLIFISQPPYNTTSSIANLTSSDLAELTHINNISSTTAQLPRGKEIIIPVNCSCSAQYYQANTSYTVPTSCETYFTIAHSTFQGLTTCNALIRQNIYSPLTSLAHGSILKVPLRCACPTRNQKVNGTKFLLAYLISQGDNVGYISERFNTSEENVLLANGFTEYPTIFPFTTILIPLSNEPLSSLTTIHHSETPISSPPYIPIHMYRKRNYVWIGVASGGSLGVFCSALFLVLWYYWRKRKNQAAKNKGKKKFDLPKDFLRQIANVDQGLKFHTYEELLAATENFSIRNMITSSVYRGVLNGVVVAIKKTRNYSTREVNLLKKINHFNVNSLLGVCQHLGDYYLVYKFMENGSLNDWLHGKIHHHRGMDGWNHRVQIALDIAHALNYLHNFTNPACVHKNLSSGNILLDKDLRAKISNFSLAGFSAENWNFGNSSIKTAEGTKGYIAPAEFIEYLLVTPALDTYAFGVVLLELITGKEAVYMQDGGVLLVASVLSIMDGEDTKAKLGRLIDPNLQEYLLIELAWHMMKLSLACLAEEPENRPNMDKVVSNLMKIQLDM